MIKKRFFLFNFFVSCFFITDVFANENEDAKTDILFLKIQELEAEIAELRNKIESQNYLIDKLIEESVAENNESYSDDIEDLALNADIKFKGIEDPKSKEQVYTSAIDALEAQDLERAFNLFAYFVESFDDDEKTPLALFWLGEISLIDGNLSKSEDFFMELISSFPSHYRIPLAHKKIGDIYFKNNNKIAAKDKYNFVVREYPNNTASSLALQLLKNME